MSCPDMDHISLQVRQKKRPADNRLAVLFW
jgi:hypothetical protein